MPTKDKGSGPRNWWSRIPPTERTERMRALAIKREAAKTPEERKAASKRAIETRWAKHKKLSTD